MLHKEPEHEELGPTRQPTRDLHSGGASRCGGDEGAFGGGLKHCARGGYEHVLMAFRDSRDTVANCEVSRSIPGGVMGFAGVAVRSVALLGAVGNPLRL